MYFSTLNNMDFSKLQKKLNSLEQFFSIIAAGKIIGMHRLIIDCMSFIDQNLDSIVYYNTSLGYVHSSTVMFFPFLPDKTAPYSAISLCSLFINLTFNNLQRFSIGLRSGLKDGHSKTSILLSVNHFLVNLAVCLWIVVLYKSSNDLLDWDP